jgi:hypothetical protein
MPLDQDSQRDNEQLDRIEAKLDMLIQALAEDDDDDGPTHDLDGNPLPAARDENDVL